MNYLNHLRQLSSNKTFQRKLDYIHFNFKSLLPQGPIKDYSALEIGPGFGEFIQYLNSKGITNIDVVDNNKEVLNHIKKSYKTNKLIFGSNIARLNKKLDKYNTIFLLQILEHIPKSEYKSFIKTLYSHLKPGGKIIITVPNAGSPFSITERYGDLQHQNIFTVFTLNDLCLYSGIRNYSAKIQPFRIPPYSAINLVRIAAQSVLHALLLLAYFASGGVYQTIFHPNISLVISKKKS